MGAKRKVEKKRETTQTKRDSWHHTKTCRTERGRIIGGPKERGTGCNKLNVEVYSTGGRLRGKRGQHDGGNNYCQGPQLKPSFGSKLHRLYRGINGEKKDGNGKRREGLALEWKTDGEMALRSNFYLQPSRNSIRQAQDVTTGAAYE